MTMVVLYRVSRGWQGFYSSLPRCRDAHPSQLCEGYNIFGDKQHPYCKNAWQLESGNSG